MPRTSRRSRLGSIETLEDRRLLSTTSRLERLASLPFAFEPNLGQADASVIYLARGADYAIALSPTQTVLTLATGQPGAAPASVRMTLVGARENASLSGLAVLPGVSNYLSGGDPSRWVTRVPHYGKVLSQGVYPGVDVVHDGSQGKLEYDFLVAPGADPGVIRMSYEGASGIEIDAAGNLVVHTSAGDVQHQAPVSYQDIGGTRRPVPSQFVLLGPNEVGFRLGEYDRSQPLTIDPVLVYSALIGGPFGNSGSAIAVDSQGASYITGVAIAASFPPYDVSAGTFVMKINPAGTSYEYATYLVGVGFITGIAVDGSGSAYVASSAAVSRYPVMDSMIPTPSDGSGAAVLKLTPSGDGLVYAAIIGGNGENENANAIAIGPDGSAFITGMTTSTDFPTVNAVQPALRGEQNAFVARISPSGTSLLYSTYLGGSGTETGMGIALDSAGSAFVTGNTTSTNFPTANALQPTFGGVQDAFVAKFSPTGSSLVYSTYLGGAEREESGGIAVGPDGSAYATGSTKSTDFPTLNPLIATRPGVQGVYVTRLKPDGSALTYSTYLGGSVSQNGFAIAVDPLERAYLAGSTNSGDFPTANPVQGTIGSGTPFYGNAFVTVLNAEGSGLLFSTFLGGSLFDEARGIAVGPEGGIYVVGTAGSMDFPTVNSFGSFQGQQPGYAMVFAAKYSPILLAATSTLLTVTPSPSPPGTPVVLTATVATSSGIVASGVVTFRDGDTILGIVPLDTSGQASLVTAGLGLGLHLLTASFPGDSSNAPSAGSSPLLVGVSATTTTLTASPSPSLPGLPVVLTAIVAAADGSPAVGTVTFREGDVVLGVVALDAGGRALLLSPSLAEGVHVFTASYSGSATTMASAGATTQVTTAPATITDVARIGFHRQPSRLVITFSAALDPSRATRRRAYRLIALRGGRTINLKTIAYDETSRTVTLRPSSRLPLRSRYVLTVRGTGAGALLDADHRPIAASLSTRSGTDFETIIARHNLIIPRKRANR